MEEGIRAWNFVRPEDEVPNVVATLRQAGFSQEAVTRFLPALMFAWGETPERQFGHLPPETIARIKATDRKFVVQLRTITLRQRRGEISIAAMNEARLQLDRQWDKEVRSLLDPTGVAELSLVNSRSARRVREMVRGLEVSDDELQRLYRLRQAYDDKRGMSVDGMNLRVSPDDHWGEAVEQVYLQGVRDVLGEQRFLKFALQNFPFLVQDYEAIKDLPGLTTSTALDLWWLHREMDIAEWRLDEQQGLAPKDRLEARQVLRANTCDRARNLLGPAAFKFYRRQPTGVWLAVIADQTKPSASSP